MSVIDRWLSLPLAAVRFTWPDGRTELRNCCDLAEARELAAIHTAAELGLVAHVFDACRPAGVWRNGAEGRRMEVRA